MQRTGLKRGGKGNEKYYTKPEVVNKCLEEFKKLNIDKTTDVVIEPSAGNGSFTTRLVEYNSISYDIVPEGENIIEQDFLKLDLTARFQIPLHFIGNPPFGLRGQLALKFINHAATFCDYVAFILPQLFESDGKGVPRKRVIGLNLIHS